MDLHEELADLLDLLSRERIDYALCGGLALAVHGFPRATKDIDLLVRPEDAARLAAAVAPLGYVLDAGELPFDAGKARERRVRRIVKTEGPEVLTLDLVLLPEWLEDVWNTRQVLDWGDRRITVVSREGLLAMKRVAGRPQDLADIARLEGETDEGD